MKERLDDPLYSLLQNTYEELLLDYAVLEGDDYQKEDSHKQAAIQAVKIFGTRSREQPFQEPLWIQEEHMQCKRIETEEFFCEDWEKYIRLENGALWRPIPVSISYWEAFIDPPYGVPYTKEDFHIINELLFPYREDLEIYRWKDNFSNYFMQGKEWWGTGLWSIYDRKLCRFVVIGASLTD